MYYINMLLSLVPKKKKIDKKIIAVLIMHRDMGWEDFPKYVLESAVNRKLNEHALSRYAEFKWKPLYIQKLLNKSYYTKRTTIRDKSLLEDVPFEVEFIDGEWQMSIPIEWLNLAAKSS